ncbi:MAG: VWA domain-containing protein [Acidobacteriaceae bacterium]
MRQRTRQIILTQIAKLLVLPGLLICLPVGTPQLRAQASTSAQQTPPPTESQPSLTVDRDPVSSPDATVPQKPGAAEAGQVSRGEHGRFTLRQDVDEVVLNATVLDSHNQLVMSLNKDDFQVFEDGVPQTIAAFRHEDIPVSIGILIDNSGSMSDKRRAVNQAAIDLVKSSNPEDEDFVVNFSEEAYIDADFTSDIGKLEEGLSHIDSKGGTALYDAVLASADYLAKNGKRPKQVLLVITDGEDNASNATLEDAIRRVQDLSGPVVYTIGLMFGDDDSPRTQRRAKRALQELSDQTGGLAFFPKSLKNVDAVAAEVAQDIRNQYTIGYHSTNPPARGGYRIVRVIAKAKGYGRLTVRTRAGYYPRGDRSRPTATGPANSVPGAQPPPPKKR